MVSQERLQEFQKLCQEELSVELDNQVASELAERFLAAFRVAYRPIPSGKEKYAAPTI